MNLSDLNYHDSDEHWVTKDGTVVRISEMTNDHLLNTIRWLMNDGRRRRLLIVDHPPNFQGEMASYYADQEWFAACDADDADYTHWKIDFLIDEAFARDLDLLPYDGDCEDE